ncbi:MAG: lipopolysaccharide biosynthesis protein [Ancrocorticia sp.]
MKDGKVLPRSRDGFTPGTRGAEHTVSTTGLGGRAARGAAVTLSAQAARMIIQFAGVAILARLLAPGDYGLVALALSIVTFGEIFRDFGLSSAAIQAPTLSRAERDNLFWLNTLIGVILTALVFAAAPLVANLSGHPPLEGITQTLAPVFLLNGLTTQYRANLVRGLRFKAIAATEVSSAALGLVAAIVSASMGVGYWALVIQQLTAAAFLLLGMAIAGRWLPRGYTRGVSMRRFMRFGINLLGSQIVGYVANNVDTWTIGTRFGEVTLGFYNRAFQLLMTPMNQIRTPSTTVALPVLSKVSPDQPRFERFVRQGQLALALPTGLAMALVAGGASAIIPVVLGDGWEVATPYLRLFAIAALFQTLAFVGYWIYLARNLTNVLFRYSIATAILKIVCILGGSYWGPIGLAVGYAVAPMLEWPISFWWLGRHTEIPRRALYGNALRVVAQAAIVGAASYTATEFSSSMSDVVSLLLGGVAGMVAYLLLIALIPPFRNDLKQVFAMAAMVRGKAGGKKGGNSQSPDEHTDPSTQS